MPSLGRRIAVARSKKFEAMVEQAKQGEPDAKVSQMAHTKIRIYLLVLSGFVGACPLLTLSVKSSCVGICRPDDSHVACAFAGLRLDCARHRDRGGDASQRHRAGCESANVDNNNNNNNNNCALRLECFFCLTLVMFVCCLMIGTVVFCFRR